MDINSGSVELSRWHFIDITLTLRSHFLACFLWHLPGICHGYSCYARAPFIDITLTLRSRFLEFFSMAFARDLPGIHLLCACSVHWLLFEFSSFLSPWFNHIWIKLAQLYHTCPDRFRVIKVPRFVCRRLCDLFYEVRYGTHATKITLTKRRDVTGVLSNI